MSIQLPIVNTASDTFQNWIDRTNGIVNTIANSVITANTNANGATTTGNAFVTGTFGATTIVVGTAMRGGNVQSAANLSITSNAIFSGNLITLGANLTVNTSAVVIGANLVLTDSRLSYGNSTVNAVLNSTALALGPNATLTGIGLSFGNNTVNAVVNTTGLSINGVLAPTANNSEVVAINGTLVGSASRINFIGAGSTVVSGTLDAGNSQINVTVSSSASLANGAGGVNTNIIFNDSGTLGGSAGLLFDKTSNTATVGNTVVVGTTVVNSSLIFVGNNTVNSVSNSTGRTLSSPTLTTSYGTAGLNIGGSSIVNTTVFFTGNTTINAISNSSIVVFSNSAVTSSYGTGGVFVGANVIVSTSGALFGNASVNAVVNSTSVTFSGSATGSLSSSALVLGANLVVNTTFFLLGNTTVSWSGNSSQLQVANATVATIANSNGLAVGSNVSLTYQGIIIGSTTANSSAVVAAAYLGSGIATASQYWANTAGKVVTTDVLNNSGAYTTLADLPTIAWDMSTGINFQVTLQGNHTIGNPTNAVIGRSGVLRVNQDATGGRTLSFGNAFFFDSDVAPVIGTGASKINFLYYHCFAANQFLITLAAKSV